MTNKTDEIKKDLNRLVKQGGLLYYSIADEYDQLPESFKKKLKKDGVDLPNLRLEYEAWYSEAMYVVKQIIPDRIEDFVKQYKDEKRKKTDFLTYGISDYLIGLQTTNALGEVVVDGSAAIPKMGQQQAILKSAQARFDSTLFDMQEVLQSDLFDSELDAAKELNKNGFIRAGGAIAGVVLEKHLGHICLLHDHKSRKKHPAISDFNQLLKDNTIIDTPKWRFIQHLGDLRNLCDHPKEREPTKEDVEELIEGVIKVIKTVY